MNERLAVDDYVRYMGMDSGTVHHGDYGWIRGIGVMDGIQWVVITMEKSDVSDAVKKWGFCSRIDNIEMVTSSMEEALNKVKTNALWGLA